jgi:hypothetical protein
VYLSRGDVPLDSIMWRGLKKLFRLKIVSDNFVFGQLCCGNACFCSHCLDVAQHFCSNLTFIVTMIDYQLNVTVHISSCEFMEQEKHFLNSFLMLTSLNGTNYFKTLVKFPGKISFLFSGDIFS